jgi:hypothetical protein
MRAIPTTRMDAARRCLVLRLMLTAALLGLTASLTTEPSTKWVIMVRPRPKPCIESCMLAYRERVPPCWMLRNAYH